MEQQVAAHYRSDSLITRIEAALAATGLSSKTLQRSALAPLDEFHIGGQDATRLFCDNMPLLQGRKILDIGCGIGGPARFFADQFGSHVTGIDLTPDYITAGNKISEWVGLSDRVSLVQGSATNLPFDEDSFDVAYMMHVGMNIDDKASLAENAYRALRPGGSFAIYDVMKVGGSDTIYPLPWAENASMDATSAPAIYRAALANAGFILHSEIDRSALAIKFFDRMISGATKVNGPPALGLHILMGASAPQKITNIATQIKNGVFAPIEMIATKAD